MKKNDDDDIENETRIPNKYHVDELHSAQGKLFLTHPRFDQNDERNTRKDLVMLDDPDVNSFVFEGIKIRNIFLHYNLTVVLTKKTRYDKKIMKCVKIRTTPLKPLTGKMILTMIYDELLNASSNKEDEMRKFYTFSNIAPFYPNQEYDEKDVSTLLTSWDKFSEAMDNSVFLKQYFLSEELNILKEYYDEETLLSMTWKDLIELLQVLKNDPIKLAIHTLNPFKRRVRPDPLMEKTLGVKLDTHFRLLELGYDSIVKIIDTYKLFDIPRHQISAIMIYDNLKKDRDEKYNCFSVKSEIIFMSMQNRFSLLEATSGLTFLEKTGVVEVIQEEIYLKNVKIWEDAISCGIAIISDRRAKMEAPMEFKTLNPFEIISKKGLSLCDEQIEAFKLLLVSPFVVIAGGGGAGKTSLIESYIHNMILPNKKVLLLSFMGSNVNSLDKILPGRAFTIHFFASVHYNTCTKNKKRESQRGDDRQESTSGSGKKYKSKCGIDYNECIMEDIEVIIVDEAGNNGTQLLSIPITLGACCGKTIQVVLVGDRAQLKPIDTGDPFTKIINVATQLNTCIQFKHNHRVTEDSKIMFDNSNAILERKPEKITFDSRIATHYDIPPGKKASDVVLAILKSNNIDEYKHQVITYTRKVKSEVEWAVDCYYYELEHKGCVARKKTHLKGRKITFKQNNYELGIFTNSVYILTNIVDSIVNKNGTSYSETRQGTEFAIPMGYKRDLYIKPLNSEKLIIVPWDEWCRKYISYSAVSTNHGFRGLEIDTVIVLMPYWGTWETIEALYTAFTRATKSFFFVGNLNYIVKSINNPTPPRNSSLDKSIMQICCDTIGDILSRKVQNFEKPAISFNFDDEWLNDHALGAIDKLVEEASNGTQTRSEQKYNFGKKRKIVNTVIMPPGKFMKNSLDSGSDSDLLLNNNE